MTATIGDAAPVGRRRFFKGAAWAAVEQWSQHVIQLVTFVVIGNLIGPGAVGTMNMAIVIVLLVHAFLLDGFGEALVQRREIEPEHLDVTFWLLAALGGTAGLIVFAGAPLLADAFGAPLLAEILPWLAPTFVLVAAGAPANCLLRRRLEFRSLALRSFGAYGTASGLAVILAWHGWGVWALVVYQIALRVLEVTILLACAGWRPHLRFSRRHFRELAGFGFSSLSYQLTSYVTIQAERVIVGVFLGPVALGLFGMAKRLFEAIGYATTGVVAKVALPSLSRLQHDLPRLARTLITVSRITAAGTAPLYFGLAATAHHLVALAFSAEWQSTVPLLRLLALSGFFGTLGAMPIAAILATGAAKIVFRVNVFIAVIRVASGLVAIHFGSEAIAGATSLASALSFLSLAAAAAGCLGTSMLRHVLAVAGPFAAAVAMAALVTLADRNLLVGLDPFSAVMALIPIGATAYVLLLVLFNKVIRRELMALAPTLRARRAA